MKNNHTQSDIALNLISIAKAASKMNFSQHIHAVEVTQRALQPETKKYGWRKTFGKRITRIGIIALLVTFLVSCSSSRHSSLRTKKYHPHHGAMYKCGIKAHYRANYE